MNNIQAGMDVIHHLSLLNKHGKQSKWSVLQDAMTSSLLAGFYFNEYLCEKEL